MQVDCGFGLVCWRRGSFMVVSLASLFELTGTIYHGSIVAEALLTGLGRVHDILPRMADW